MSPQDRLLVLRKLHIVSLNKKKNKQTNKQTNKTKQKRECQPVAIVTEVWTEQFPQCVSNETLVTICYVHLRDS